MMAAVATGQHDDFRTATDAMIRLSNTVEPDPELAAIYHKAYPLFRDLGHALEPLWASRGRILAKSANRQELP